MLAKKIQRLKLENILFHNAKRQQLFLSESAFYYLGLALYWSEGFKKEYSLGLANSDPYLVKLFIRWLCRFGNVDLSDITIRVQINRIYQGVIGDIEMTWSRILQIPITQFKKPYFQYSKRKAYYDPNYLGLVRVRAKGTRNFLVSTLGSIESLRR